jgi:hypothetical protein
MTNPFTDTEATYLLAWAIEDHKPSPNGPARTLQRQHGVHAAVLGQLFARLATAMGRPQFELIEGPAPEGPLLWPWPTQDVLESRLQALLPESTLRYLEELGATASVKV